MSSYSVVVSAFLRPKKLDRCLGSVSRLVRQPNKVVVVDDSGRRVNQEVYDRYEDDLNLEVRHLEYDSGLAVKRNTGIGMTDTPYILLLDDDQYVSSNLHELAAILQEKPELGGVAPYWVEDGVVRSNAANYNFKRGWVIKDAPREKRGEETNRGHLIYRYDHIPNSAMFRREVFQDYSWDENYVIEGEDSDFYLKHRELGKWEFAVTPDYVVRHDPGAGIIDEFKKERRDIEKLNESLNYLTNKFGIKGLFQFGSHVPPDRPIREKVLFFIATHLIPHRVLWWIRRKKLWYPLENYIKD